MEEFKNKYTQKEKLKIIYLLGKCKIIHFKVATNMKYQKHVIQ